MNARVSVFELVSLSPISMFVTPAPVLTLLLRSQPIVFPIPSLTSLFHQPVPISAALVLVPFHANHGVRNHSNGEVLRQEHS